jgi:hypothetical protein
MVPGISGSFYPHPWHGSHPRVSIIKGIIPHPVTMGQIIITTPLIENGFQATGRIDGPPMVGKGPGFQAISNTAHNGLKIA